MLASWLSTGLQVHNAGINQLWPVCRFAHAMSARELSGSIDDHSLFKQKWQIWRIAIIDSPALEVYEFAMLIYIIYYIYAGFIYLYICITYKYIYIYILRRALRQATNPLNAYESWRSGGSALYAHVAWPNLDYAERNTREAPIRRPAPFLHRRWCIGYTASSN